MRRADNRVEYTCKFMNSEILLTIAIDQECPDESLSQRGWKVSLEARVGTEIMLAIREAISRVMEKHNLKGEIVKTMNIHD